MRGLILMAIATVLSLPTPASAHGAPGSETVTLISSESIANIPGKRLVSLLVDYPPGVQSIPHLHAKSSFIHAYVLSGRIRSQVNDEPVRVYLPGEWWSEKPGSRHRVSANASDTEPARLLAIFIVDEGDEPLTTPDPHP